VLHTDPNCGAPFPVTKSVAASGFMRLISPPLPARILPLGCRIGFFLLCCSGSGLSHTNIKDWVHDRLSHTNIKDWVHDRLSHTNIKDWAHPLNLFLHRVYRLTLPGICVCVCCVCMCLCLCMCVFVFVHAVCALCMYACACVCVCCARAVYMRCLCVCVCKCVCVCVHARVYFCVCLQRQRKNVAFCHEPTSSNRCEWSLHHMPIVQGTSILVTMRTNWRSQV
jgi:hypothetical protein